MKQAREFLWIILGLFYTPVLSLSSFAQTQSAPIAVCGNRTVEATESCDDGNTASQDGCSSTCQKEVFLATPASTFDFDREGSRLFTIWQKEASSPLSYTPEEQKSVERAKAYSFLGTVSLPILSIVVSRIPLELVEFENLRSIFAARVALLSISAASLLIGPSLGYLYLGDKKHTWQLIGRRTLSFGVTALGGAATVFGIGETFRPDGNTALGLPLVSVGLPVFIAGFISSVAYTFGDIAWISTAAEHHNFTVRQKKALDSLGLAPLVLPGPDGAAPGLSLSGQF